MSEIQFHREEIDIDLENKFEQGRPIDGKTIGALRVFNKATDLLDFKTYVPNPDLIEEIREEIAELKADLRGESLTYRQIKEYNQNIEDGEDRLKQIELKYGATLYDLKRTGYDVEKLSSNEEIYKAFEEVCNQAQQEMDTIKYSLLNDDSKQFTLAISNFIKKYSRIYFISKALFYDIFLAKSIHVINIMNTEMTFEEAGIRVIGGIVKKLIENTSLKDKVIDSSSLTRSAYVLIPKIGTIGAVDSKDENILHLMVEADLSKEGMGLPIETFALPSIFREPVVSVDELTGGNKKAHEEKTIFFGNFNMEGQIYNSHVSKLNEFLKFLTDGKMSREYYGKQRQVLSGIQVEEWTNPLKAEYMMNNIDPVFLLDQALIEEQDKYGNRLNGFKFVEGVSFSNKALKYIWVPKQFRGILIEYVSNMSESEREELMGDKNPAELFVSELEDL